MIFVLKPAVPMPVTAFCEYMGNTTIPLSMILIGVSTAQTDMRDVFGEWRIYCFILIRMVLLPLTMIWLPSGIRAKTGSLIYPHELGKRLIMGKRGVIRYRFPGPLRMSTQGRGFFFPTGIGCFRSIGRKLTENGIGNAYYPRLPRYLIRYGSAYLLPGLHYGSAVSYPYTF